MDALDELYRYRMQARTFSRISDRQEGPIGWIADSLRSHTELVRGSAYPEQTGEEIDAIQGTFENWFFQRIGIGPKRAKELLLAIMMTQEENIHEFMEQVFDHGNSFKEFWKRARKKKSAERTEEEQYILSICKDSNIARIFGYVQRLNQIAPDLVPISREELRFIEEKPAEEEWNALISLVGMTAEKRAAMSDPIEVKKTPLFVLPDGQVFLADISNAMDVLWDRFDEASKADSQFFDRRDQRKKAKWLEDKVFVFLSRIFPETHIYQNLSYPDPDKQDSSAAELDLAVHWGHFLILAEAKARQFRIESQLGDVGRLRTGIRANVEKAFEQARRAARYIQATSNPVFTEISTGRQLSFKTEGIRRVYVVTVSQHNLAGRATRLAEFEGLGLFKDKEYPFSICISDLDTVSQFCEGPDVFLHYVERRLEVQRENIDMLADELELFGAYLQTRLQAERIWKRDGQHFNGVTLNGYQELFDQWVVTYIRGDNVTFRVFVWLAETSKTLNLSWVFPNSVPASRKAVILDLLDMLNYRVFVGKFIMNPDNGTLSFRISYTVKGSRFSMGQFDDFINWGIWRADEHYTKFMSLIYGDHTVDEVLEGKEKPQLRLVEKLEGQGELFVEDEACT
jgi:hypothetical protein